MSYQHQIELAIDKQDRICPLWRERAQGYLSHFLASKPQSFTIEHFRAYAEPLGLEEPDNGGAYGAIILGAARQKKIKKIGYAQATRASAHSRPLRVWACV